MEKHTKHPARHTKVPKHQIVPPQRVAGRYLLSNLGYSPIVREEVEQAEEDGGWLLHAEEAVEGPFTVELEDGLEVGRFAFQALIGDDMLAGVVAFRRAGPEEEAALEGWEGV